MTKTRGVLFIRLTTRSRKTLHCAAIEVRDHTGHEGIRHFLQLSSPTLPDEIRRQHGMGSHRSWRFTAKDVDANRSLSTKSPGAAQILRLSRYRAARIGVDVNLHTGRWSSINQ